MKTKSISQLIHIAVILSFFLPFYYVGCDESSNPESRKENSESVEEMDTLGEENMDTEISSDSITISDQIQDDSVIANGVLSKNIPADTSQEPSASKDSAIMQSKQLNSAQDTLSDKQETDQIESDRSLLIKILKPSEDTVSGIGVVVETFPGLLYGVLAFSFVLLFLGIVVKFMEPSALKTILLLDILILSGIIGGFFEWHIFNEKLWGYWVAFALTVILISFDIYAFIKNRSDRNTT